MFNRKESEVVELKANFNDEAITREIVAFLNARGGVIYIGVDNNNEVIGANNIDESLRRLSDIVSNKIEPLPTGLINANIILEEGKPIIEITISKGFYSLYCIKKYGFSQAGCPQRVGTTCKELSIEDIKLRYQKRFESSNDFMLQIPAGYGDISFNTLQVYLLNVGYHLNSFAFEENYHLKNKEGEYNLLGELMSDNNNTHLTFVKFRGKDKTSISERSNYGRTCLITSYKQIKDRLIAENICMSDTTSRPRKDTYLFDMDAVNEALINALVHNDWNMNEPLISMYEDRLEIISYGGLPFKQSKDKFLKGISVPRNRALMRIFQDLEIAESTGHGVLTIINRYGKEVFEFNDSYINVVIPFNNQVLKNRNQTKSLINGIIGEEIKDDINKYAIKAIENIIINPNINQEELAKKLKVGKRTVSRIIFDLKNKNYIERVGSNKTGYWKVLK